jgi:hypothetical protein
MESDSTTQFRRDGIGVDDGTRIEHGDGCVYSAGERGTHRMREHAVGVGDVGAVSCRAWGRRDTSSGDDGRRAGRERKPAVVDGHRRTESDAAHKPRWDECVFDDGPRIEHGDGGVYSAGERGAHGMRGHAVGVGDVDAVSCGARGRRDTSGGDNWGHYIR